MQYVVQMTNSVDSDQTAHWGAVWSGSALFFRPICLYTEVFQVYNILNIIWNIARGKYFDMASKG